MTGWTEFAALAESVQKIKQDLGLRPHEECFFRGHRDAAYKLLPSLFREQSTSEEYWHLERRAFFEFRARARQLYSRDHSDWDVLFHMQHHGLPTRLLDWTSVFGVALYFALLHYDDKTSVGSPCIWVLNPYELNKATWGIHVLFDPKYLTMVEKENRSYEYSELLLGTFPISWNTPIALYSRQWSDRMFAQSGWFTIHGTDSHAIEEIFNDKKSILQKLDIPKSTIPAAREFLSFAGIDERLMFPDLDGLARSVSAKYGIKR